MVETVKIWRLTHGLESTPKRPNWCWDGSYQNTRVTRWLTSKFGVFFRVCFWSFFGIVKFGVGVGIRQSWGPKVTIPGNVKKVPIRRLFCNLTKFGVSSQIWPNVGFHGSMVTWSEDPKFCIMSHLHVTSRFVETVKTWFLTSQIPNYDRPQISHRSVVVLQDTTAVRTNRSAGIFDRSDRTSTITQFLVEWRRCETRLPMLTLLVDDDASQRGK